MLLPNAIYVRSSIILPVGKDMSNRGGMKFSFMVLGEIQRSKLKGEPALSLVPERRAPPKGC